MFRNSHLEVRDRSGDNNNSGVAYTDEIMALTKECLASGITFFMWKGSDLQRRWSCMCGGATHNLEPWVTHNKKEMMGYVWKGKALFFKSDCPVSVRRG